MTTNNPISLDSLEVKLKSTLAMTNHGEAERDRNIVKTGALLSIARSLEANKVPDHWESLEGPSGAILGWFDPQVARAIAQALGATQAREAVDEDDEPRPVIVGSTVALTAALSAALELGDPSIAGLGEVLDIGVTEDAYYAIVRWDDDAPDVTPGKVWVTDLTAIDKAEADPLTPEQAAAWATAGESFLPEGHDEAKVNHYYNDGLGDPATCDDEGHNHPDDLAGGGPEDEGDLDPDTLEPIVDNDGFDIEPDTGAGDPGPEPEVDDDDIDADFDVVVDDTPPAVDGLAALKGKSKRK